MKPDCLIARLVSAFGGLMYSQFNKEPCCEVSRGVIIAFRGTFPDLISLSLVFDLVDGGTYLEWKDRGLREEVYDLEDGKKVLNRWLCIWWKETEDA